LLWVDSGTEWPLSATSPCGRSWPELGRPGMIAFVYG